MWKIAAESPADVRLRLGIGGMIIVGLLMWMMGGNPDDGNTFTPNYFEPITST